MALVVASAAPPGGEETAAAMATVRDVEIATVNIDKGFLGVARYIVVVRAGDGRRWGIARRFSEFHALRTELIELGGLLRDGSAVRELPFPPKQLWGSASQRVIAVRSPALAQWVNSVLRLAPAGRGQAYEAFVNQFLADDDSVDRATLKYVGLADDVTPRTDASLAELVEERAASTGEGALVSGLLGPRGLLPRSYAEWAFYGAAPLAFALATRTASAKRNFGAYQIAHGLWGLWCTCKGLGFLRRFGLAPFSFRAGGAVAPAVCRRWLREFGLYLVSELCWAACIGDRWMILQHHLPILLFYKFAQTSAVAQPLLIALAESVNIPIAAEGLMRWQPALHSAARALALRRLKLGLVLGVRLPLNAVMLAMTWTSQPRSSAGPEDSTQRRLRRTKRAVRLFSLLWLAIDLDMARHLLRGTGWSDAVLRRLAT